MIKQIITTVIIFLLLHFEAQALQYHTKATQAIVYELNSDTTLFAHNAEEKMVPSSMSKLMTLYIAFSYIKAGIVKMDDKFKVSKAAWQRGGSSMFLREGQSVSVRDLINGIISVSGNDASITLAEGISGSQKSFVEEMNEFAKKLELNDSHFTNVTGWPDSKHVMSARDLVVLSKRLFIDFPEYYHLFSNQEFSFNGIPQPNTNIKLLTSDTGIDGIKTGHTNAGGYGVVASAEQNGRRIFVVVNGLQSDEERAAETKRLVTYAFNKFDSRTILKQNSQIEEASVWYGKDKSVPLTVKDDVTISYSKSSYDKIKVSLSYDNIIPAPIEKGQQVGELHIKIPEIGERIFPVYAMKSVPQLNYIERLWRKIF